VKTVNFIEEEKNNDFFNFFKSWLMPVPAAAVIQIGQALLFLN